MRIKKIERLIVKYHEQIVGTLSLTPDNKQCAFEYDKTWLSNGFSISPLELPLKLGLFKALTFLWKFRRFRRQSARRLWSLPLA